MKYFILLLTMFALANCLISESAQAGQASFDRGHNPFASKALLNDEGLNKQISLIENLSFPTQVVVTHNANNKSESSLVLLSYQQKASLSPSWFYLMMIVVLAILLLWDDEPIKKGKRNRAL